MLKPGQTKDDLPLWKLMASGSFSGIAYWAAFFSGRCDQIATANQPRQKPEILVRFCEHLEIVGITWPLPGILGDGLEGHSLQRNSVCILRSL